MSRDEDTERRLCLTRISRASRDWTNSEGVEYRLPSPGRDALLPSGSSTRDFTVAVPSRLWDDLPEPRSIVPTDTGRTPPQIVGLLAWFSAHPHPPLPNLHRPPPDGAFDDSHLAATLTVLGCMAARRLAKSSQQRRRAVATIAPHLVHTLSSLAAPPALPAALLTALTQGGIDIGRGWENWAVDRIGDAGLVEARALGYEAISIDPRDRQWIRDLVADTARRCRDHSLQPASQKPPPEQSDPTGKQGTPSGDDMSGTGEPPMLSSDSSASPATSPNEAATETALTSDDDRSTSASPSDGPDPLAPPSPPTGSPEPSSSETDRSNSDDGTSIPQTGESGWPASGGTPSNESSPDTSADETAPNSDDGMSSSAPTTTPPHSQSAVPPPGPQSADGNPGIASTSSDDTSTSPQQEPGCDTTECKQSPPIPAGNPSPDTTPNDQVGQDKTASTSGDDRSTGPSDDQPPASETGSTPSPAEIPPELIAAVAEASATYSRKRRATLPKQRPSPAKLEKVKAHKDRGRDRDTGGRQLDKVFPPGTPSPARNGQVTHTPSSGRGKNSRTAITWHTPQPLERRTARKIATALRKAKLREPSITDYWRTEPPGRINMHAAMQEEALQSMGVDIDLPIFQATRIDPAPEPELAVGFCVDISGSMRWATEVAPSITWCILKAVHDMGGRTCAVRFGNGVHPLFPPGVVPNLIPKFSVSGGGGHSYTAALHTLDAALKLQDTPAAEVAKLVFVFSDGIFGDREVSTGSALAERLHRRAGVRFVWVAVPPAEPRAPGELLSLDRTGHVSRDGTTIEYGDLPKQIADVVVRTLRNHRG